MAGIAWGIVGKSRVIFTFDLIDLGLHHEQL